MKKNKETLVEKKLRLLKEFEAYITDKNEEEYIVVDNTLPKNTIVVTNHETGDVLHLKTKIEGDKLVFTDIVIPKKKKANKNAVENNK